jgi:hypothetical protein
VLQDWINVALKALPAAGIKKSIVIQTTLRKENKEMQLLEEIKACE